MECRRVSTLRNLCVLLCFFTGVVRTQNFIRVEQTFVPFPTRFSVQDRRPDVVISEDLRNGLGTFHNIIKGEFNGDRIDDLLITNSSADGSVPGAGRASVFLGGSSFGSSSSINLTTNQPDLAILGPNQFAQLGYSAAAGDLNGDRIDDIILTATGTKAIYVIFGSPVFTNRIIDLSRAQADVTVLSKPSDNFINGLAVGDIDGDGFNDLIFGRVAGGPTNIALLLGPFRSTTTFNLASTEPDIVIHSSFSGFDSFGYAIAVGDLNADGISDLVIGDPVGAGAVYVLKGSPALARGLSPSVAQPLLTILGAFVGSDFGLGDSLGRVLAVADVNADGIDDIVMGVPSSIRLGNGPGPPRPERHTSYLVLPR